MSSSGLSIGAWLAFGQLCGPIMLLMLLIGVSIGILQTATQMREAAIPFIFKMAGLAALTTVAGPFLMSGIDRYTARLILAIPSLIHG
ncbi:flagellar biosynthetic protein FliQ [Acidisoma sp.]|uniref:flagellar biosynthetic protein FliQ n=1 Tax=Acidisoma sp. TaxID=1872115 RepID=UPI003B004DC6